MEILLLSMWNKLLFFLTGLSLGISQYALADGILDEEIDLRHNHFFVKDFDNAKLHEVNLGPLARIEFEEKLNQVGGLQEGDLVFSRIIEGATSFVFSEFVGYYTHIGVCVLDDKENKLILEITSDVKKIQLKDVYSFFFPNIVEAERAVQAGALKRLKIPMTAGELKRFREINRFILEHRNTIKFDFSYGYSLLKKTSGKFIGEALKANPHFYCSEIIASIYKHAMNLPLDEMDRYKKIGKKIIQEIESYREKRDYFYFVKELEHYENIRTNMPVKTLITPMSFFTHPSFTTLLEIKTSHLAIPKNHVSSKLSRNPKPKGNKK